VLKWVVACGLAHQNGTGWDEIFNLPAHFGLARLA